MYYSRELHVYMYMYMNKSGGPEQARQTADSCFELVGSHQCRVCTSCSGRTGFMYPTCMYMRKGLGIYFLENCEKLAATRDETGTSDFSHQCSTT